jgi:hypothetical protein
MTVRPLQSAWRFSRNEFSGNPGAVQTGPPSIRLWRRWFPSLPARVDRTYWPKVSYRENVVAPHDDVVEARGTSKAKDGSMTKPGWQKPGGGLPLPTSRDPFSSTSIT